MANQFRESRPQETHQKTLDYEQKILDIRRVARITAGGRRFSFRAVVAIGNRSGQVGVGVKKGKDVQYAVDKCVRNAKKDLVKVSVTPSGTIPHEAYGKSGSSVVFLKPGMKGGGIIAGGAVRTICDLAGYKDIVGKILSRSGNKLNVARATIEAFKKIKSKPSPQVEGVEEKEKIVAEKEKTKDADTPTKGTKKKKS